MAEYPKRGNHFAHKFVRLMAKTCASQELGPDGCWLLTVIAMLEDSKRYSDFVTFYNGQLMVVAGFTREHTMISVRNRAVAAGWLHYEHGGKRKPGRYWVTIPGQFSAIQDGACDESEVVSTDENVRESGDISTDENVSDSVSESVGIASVKEQGKRQPSVPIPFPNPTWSMEGDMDQKSEKRHRTTVQVDQITHFADWLFQTCRYSGSQGGTLWKVAALLHTGIGDLSEAEVASAARGAAMNGRDKPAHFFTCLDEAVRKRGLALKDLLGQVSIQPTWPKTKPYKDVNHA